MGTEIERKYRLDTLPECTKDAPKAHLVNIYISTWKYLTIRVRLNLTSKLAKLTVKGPSKGISRFEEEWNIPYSLGKFFHGKVWPFLEKNRFEVKIDKHLWAPTPFINSKSLRYLYYIN